MLGDLPIAPTIPAKDIDRARTFYQDTLGLKIKDDRPDGIEFACGDGTSVVVYSTEFAGTAKNTLVSWRADDVEAEVADLKARGVKFESYDSGPLKTDANNIATMGPSKGAWFRDSEDNILAVFKP